MIDRALHGNGHSAPPHMLFATEPPRPILPSSATLGTPHGPVTVAFVRLTPEMARGLVAQMRGNRKPHRRQVEQITRALKTGEFAFNGESIILDADGRMIDGQHRCLACIAADMPLETIMVSGIRSAAFDTVDQSDRRTAGDVFSINGVPNANATTAALRKIGAHLDHSGLWNISNYAASPRELEALHERIGDISGSVVVGIAGTKALSVPGSFLSCVHFLFAKKSRADADRFFAALISGENLSSGDPILRLRHRLAANAGERKAKLSQIEMYAMFVNAWNAFRRGKTISHLRGIYDGKVPEYE